MRRILGTALLAASVAYAQEKNYSLKDVHDLFAKRGNQDMYISTEDYSIRAEVSRPKSEPVLLIYALKNGGIMEKYRKLKPNHEMIKHRFEYAADIDLIIRVCGFSFGDDDCDSYWMIHHDEPKKGEKIPPCQIQETGKIISAIGQAVFEAVK